MPGKRFDPERLLQLLAPYHFTLNSPEYEKERISFVRRSCIDRLYEHLLITTSNPVYVESVISGASFRSCHGCVSEIDGRFRAFLASDAKYQKSTLSTPAKAKAWLERLVENADAFCRSMADEKGPVLARRLEPLFKIVDTYTHALGDIFAVLEREYAFVTEIPKDLQSEADQLADQSRAMLYLNAEDAKLASVVLLRFGPAIERQESPFRGMKPFRSAALAARLILLTDYVRANRFKYDTDRGMYR